MTRKDRIAAKLDRLENDGRVTFWQLQGGMPGLRWTVAGDVVGEYVYGPDKPLMTCERSMDTREIERMLNL